MVKLSSKKSHTLWLLYALIAKTHCAREASLSADKGIFAVTFKGIKVMAPSCTPSIEQIKSGAKAIKSALHNRFDIQVNHTQSLELSAVAHGYKDFHVASASAKQNISNSFNVKDSWSNAQNNADYKQIGYVTAKEWRSAQDYFQTIYNLSVFDSSVRASIIGSIGTRYGFGGNKIFRVGEILSGTPQTLLDFYTMGNDKPMELYGIFNGIPFAYHIDGVIKIVEDTIEKFLSKSFGESFSELGQVSSISLRMWRDDEFVDEFTQTVRRIEQLMPKGKILKLKHSASPFYIDGRYMLLREEMLREAHPDGLEVFITENLLDPLTNEHIKNVIYQEAKKLAMLGINKFSDCVDRLDANDDYIDAIVEFL